MRIASMLAGSVIVVAALVVGSRALPRTACRPHLPSPDQPLLFLQMVGTVID